ncbi:unnamed protein product, partial [Dovyalis caffra]
NNFTTISITAAVNHYRRQVWHQKQELIPEGEKKPLDRQILQPGMKVSSCSVN